MLRVVVINLFFFLLPFMLYYIWAKLAKKEQGDTPFLWLLAAGIVLMIVAISFFIQLETGSPGDRYIPPHYVDGELVPGQILPPEDNP
jgi:hypothetical protein